MNSYYPVELHCHTHHSDGSMPPKMLVENAIKRGYKAVAVCDHNTVSAWADAERHGAEKGLCIIRGIEWTTFFGHITCLNDTLVSDWRDITIENIDEVSRAAYEAGAILTVAHPKRMGGPVCNGCHMDLDIKRFDYYSSFEVWSQKEDSDSRSNALSAAMYDGLLTDGYRLAAVYGYDWHSADDEEEYFTVTFIGAEEVSPSALKQGIKRGDTYLSTGLCLDVKADGKAIAFGSELPSGTHIFEISTAPSGVGRGRDIFAERVVFKGTALGADAVFDVGKPMTLTLTPGWLRIEIFGRLNGASDRPLIFTSPYYVI